MTCRDTPDAGAISDKLITMMGDGELFPPWLTNATQQQPWQRRTEEVLWLERET